MAYNCINIRLVLLFVLLSENLTYERYDERMIIDVVNESAVVMNKAKMNKNDEFYTPYNVIQDELDLYNDLSLDTSYFTNKVIYCNCDDPLKSNFVKYFVLNFSKFNLKKLICTSYSEGGRGKSLIISVATYNKYHGNLTEMLNKEMTELKGDGSFASRECRAFLKETDIVITNPPFSRFIEFFNLLIKQNKYFILLCNGISLKYKDVFNLFKAGKVKIGLGNYFCSTKFITPNFTSQNLFNKNTVNDYDKSVLVTWLTNLPINKAAIDGQRVLFSDYQKSYKGSQQFDSSSKTLLLRTLYKKGRYSYYETEGYQDVINVNNLKDIPIDYQGKIGVPVTYLQYHNEYSPFELIEKPAAKLRINGKTVFDRVIIQIKNDLFTLSYQSEKANQQRRQNREQLKLFKT